MARKLTTKAITDDAITADKIVAGAVVADIGAGTVTPTHLHSSLDLSSKTVTLPSLTNLGIGTASPAKKLHIKDSVPDIRLEDTNTNAVAEIRGNTGTGSLVIATDVNNAISSSKIIFEVDNSEAVRIQGNGAFINRTSQVSSHDAFVVSSPAGGVGGGSTRVNATITAEDLTGDGGAHANAFVVTKAKGNYYNGLEISSTSAHVGGWIGHYNGGDNYRALQARIGGTGINASDTMAMKIDVNGVVSMPVRGVLRGVNIEGVSGGYSPASVVVTANFPDVGYGAGIIQASAGHYGVTNHAAHRLSMFQAGPYFAEFNVYNHTNSAQGAWSFSWSSNTLTVTKSAGTYAGGGPYSIFVAWGRS